MLLSSLTGLILAAGLGSRLYPLTKNCHKTLISVGSQTLMDRHLQHCVQAGIKKVILLVGHRKEDLFSFIEQHPLRSEIEIQFIENKDYLSTNTGYSFYLGAKNIQGPLIAMDGDLYVETPLFNQMVKSPDENIMVCDCDKSKLNPEAVKATVNARAEITSLGKEIALDQAAGEFIGLMKFSADAVQKIISEMDSVYQKNLDQKYYEDAISRCVSTLPPLKCMETKKFIWSEIDTVEDYNTLCKTILKNQ